MPLKYPCGNREHLGEPRQLEQKWRSFLIIFGKVWSNFGDGIGDRFQELVWEPVSLNFFLLRLPSRLGGLEKGPVISYKVCSRKKFCQKIARDLQKFFEV